MTTGLKSGARIEPRTAPLGRCPLCGSRDARLLFRASDGLHGIPGIYSYSRCTSCGTVFQNPQVVPEDVHLCYPAGYYTHLPVEYGDPRASRVRRVPPPATPGSIRHAIITTVRGTASGGVFGFVGRILARSRFLRQRTFHNLLDELIPRAPGPLRAIDVGCGEGSLLLALRRAGWDASGVERDPRAAQVARRHGGGQVYDGDFRQIDIPGDPYDLVVLSHVFEHLDDPISSLRRLAALLAPGGRIVMVYPNPASLGARIFRGTWFPWEAPRHLVLPPPRALAREIHRAGLAIARIRTTARFAPVFFARSRKSRPKRAPRLVDSNVAAGDLCGGLVESLLVRLGLDMGEEVVVSLAKPTEGNGGSPCRSKPSY